MTTQFTPKEIKQIILEIDEIVESYLPDVKFKIITIERKDKHMIEIEAHLTDDVVSWFIVCRDSIDLHRVLNELYRSHCLENVEVEEENEF